MTENSSDWSDIADSELSEKIGVINSFPVEEEKKDIGDMNANDQLPEWMKFLVDKLDFRLQKINYLVEHHDIDSFEDFFNSYAPDKEGGLYNHKFMPKLKEIEEEKNNDEEAPIVCMVCD